jgi:hypothetical protein
MNGGVDIVIVATDAGVRPLCTSLHPSAGSSSGESAGFPGAIEPPGRA